MNNYYHRLPSLNALKVFEVVSRHLNFRLAAEELNVSQSAIAQQIRGLEYELGAKLFERQPKGVILTANGRNYAQSISQAFNVIYEATLSFQQHTDHITISVTPTFASKWLIPRLNNFTQLYPDIDLQILATERLSHFQNDAVDIAIRYGKPPFGAGLNTELLIKDSFIAVASPDLIDMENTPVAPEDLCKYTLLHDANNVWNHFLEHYQLRNTKSFYKNIHFNQTLLAIDAAIAAQGITLSNPIFVTSDLEAGKLIKVLKQELFVDVGYYLITPRRPEKLETITKVRNWLFSQIE